MGCFLSCFRARTDPPGGGLHDPLVHQSRLGDAFLHDDDAAAATKLEASGGTAKENLGNGGGVDDDLRQEKLHQIAFSKLKEEGHLDI